MRLIDADVLSEHKFVSIDCYLKSNVDNGYPRYKQGWNDAIDAIIDNTPTIDIPNYGGRVVPDTLQGWRYEERPQGEWLTHRVAFHLTCPFCGCNIRALKDKVFEGDYEYNFCPNCGADMREEAEE